MYVQRNTECARETIVSVQKSNKYYIVQSKTWFIFLVTDLALRQVN